MDMRFTTITLSLLALLAAPAARADEPVAVAAATPSDLAGGGSSGLATSLPSPAAVAPPDSTIRPGDVQERPWYALSDVTHIGVQLDVGAPGAGGATLLFRPWWWVRFNAGLAYDYVGFGLRGGVSVVPFHWAVTPSLNLDYGHYLSGDASRFSSSAGAAEQALLRNAVYDFATAQVGLEFGSQRWFSFYVRGGFSYISATAQGSLVSPFMTEKFGNGYQATVGDASLKAVLPCASLGFLFYVY